MHTKAVLEVHKNLLNKAQRGKYQNKMIKIYFLAKDEPICVLDVKNILTSASLK